MGSYILQLKAWFGGIRNRSELRLFPPVYLAKVTSHALKKKSVHNGINIRAHVLNRGQWHRVEGRGNASQSCGEAYLEGDCHLLGLNWASTGLRFASACLHASVELLRI